MKRYILFLGALITGAVIFMTACKKDDTTKPVITLKGNATVYIYLHVDYIEPGYTAIDNEDGDITSKVVVSLGGFNKEVVGSYTLTYTVTDAAGNTTTATRLVNVIKLNDDTTKPLITLYGNATIDVVLNATYNDPGVKAMDDVDGDITSKVKIDYGSFNKDVTGSYTLTYTVDDAAGNVAAATRTVNVKNSASSMDGAYSIVDVLDGSPAVTYTDNVISDKYVNNKIYFGTFAYFKDAKVYANITNGSTINIPIQTLVCGNDNLVRTFSGFGTIKDNNTFVINYQLIDASVVYNGIGTYTKK